MAEIKHSNDSAQHSCEIAKRIDLLVEDVALEAFELLTANNYDRVSAHALGVSL